MRYLGIDYGSKRTGVAFSDASGKIAFPHKVLLTDKKLVSEIKKICDEKKISVIVLGQSLNYKGVPNPIQSDIANFKLHIESLIKLPVHYQSEILTSTEAARSTGKDMLDSSAAALILQSYLDSI